MSLFDLTGKRAVVTGGLNGNLGPVWVETLEKAGALVNVLDLPKCDVSQGYRVNELANIILHMNGAPHIIVNSAAIDNPPGSVASFFGNFEKIMAVNITGAINVCHAFIPDMIRNGGGVIINIGSIQGYGGADWHNYEGEFEKPFGYNASKWAMRGLAKSLTTQYGRYGIRAVTISFGCVDTPKIEAGFKTRFLERVPVGRMVSRESLQMSLLYACCCPELAGVDWRIDGGLGAWA